ncbi:heavy metal translocating P-type ATPase [Nocardia sp. NPDC050717]|uniref:heavy metal translocating P-type ATPase n=1 Tax=Nocardia sp. NPDC050717 TaxID=3157221 RepID=UPI0033CBDDCF
MRWAAAATALFALGLVAKFTGGPSWLWWALLLACYATGGWEPGLEGLKALREKTLDVDLLMVVAAIGAAAIGQIIDGALLIVIFATSGALEALATRRTEDSVRGLLTLAPDTATRLDDGVEQTVAAADLAVGEVILVRPGDRIAADGRVLDGASEVDQATVTGEPLPVDKAAGDEVFAGTLNGTGALRVRVERRAEDSVVARIAALVEEAGRTKAKTQLFIEKIEQRYSIGMVVVTLAVFAVPLILGATLRDSLLRAMTFMIVASPCAVVLATMPPLLAAIANAGRHGVLVKSAVVMEQLGATTRVAFDKTGTLTRGTPELVEIHPLPGASAGPAAEHRILRLAAAVEFPSEHPLAAATVRLARQRGIPLPAVTEFAARPGRGVSGRVDHHLVRVGSPGTPPPAGPGLPEAPEHPTTCLRDGAAPPPDVDTDPADPALPALPTPSATRLRDGVAPAPDVVGHPARVLPEATEQQPGPRVRGGVTVPPGVAAPSAAIDAPARDGDSDGHASLGAAAPLLSRVRTALTADAGQPTEGVASTPQADLVAAIRSRGRTAVVVVCDEEPIGVLGFADQVRPDAGAAVAALTRMQGGAPVLLTGDNHRTAERLAEEVGITEVRAGLLPHEKVAAVRALESGGERVTMVGDGINDAPALAAAHAGIAMGGAGSDLTVQTADAIVVRDDLTAIPTVIALSRRARRVVLANLAIAATFIAVLVVWDLFGHLPLPLGVLGHEGSTVIVGLNGLRLLRSTAWHQARHQAAGSR